MTSSTPRTPTTPSPALRSRRAGTVFSAATGIGVGVGMALTFALAALSGLPFGAAMAIALPATMIVAVVVALLVVRRTTTAGPTSSR